MPNVSEATRNAMLDRIDTDFPAGSILEIRSGARPAAVTDAATGTLLASVALPAAPWAAAAAGSKSKSGTWEDMSGDADGTAGWVRIKNAGDTLRIDLTASGPGGGGEMILVNPSIATGQPVQITTLAVTL